MAQIRQEILLDVSGATSVYMDTTKYNGATYYFEVLGKDDASTATINLTSGGVTKASLTVTTTKAIVRSTSFTPVSGLAPYVPEVGTTGATLYYAKIIILQNATPITNTETQIDLARDAVSTTTSTTSVPITNPKYWKYTSANWDGTLTVYFEAWIKCASSKSATTASLQVADGTGDGFAGWTDVASSPITTTSTIGERVRSAAITLTAGRWYRVAFKSGTSKSAATLNYAKIIIDQADGAQLNPGSGGGVSWVGGTGVSTEIGQAVAQSFKINATSTISSVQLRLAKSSNPTDNLTVNITSSLGGSSLASGTIAGGSLTQSAANYTINFGTPTSLTGGTTYYIELCRDGARDTTNTYTGYVALATYNGFGTYQRDNNAWGSVNTTNNLYFVLSGQSGITKLEPQYVVSNALFAAGTSLQTFLTKWDSTEWSGVTNTYYLQAEAANGSTSDVELWEADGGGSAIGAVTNIDNAQISTSMTMPTSQDIDVKATTNAGDVAGARILVATVISSSTTTPQTILGKSRITVSTAKTLLGKGAVLDTTTKTLLGKSNVINTSTQTLSGKSRITAVGTQTIAGKARITASATQTRSGKSRITASGTKTIQGLSKISAVGTQTLLGQSRVQTTSTQTRTGNARITATGTQTVQGRSKIQYITPQTLAGKARITATGTQTITGKARITSSATKTLAGISRITATGTQTISGKSRIQLTSPQTIAGKSRVTATTPQTIAGKSRITVTQSQTIQGISNIIDQTSTTKTILGKASVKDTTSKTLQGRARIQVVSSQTIQGKSRVTVSATKTLTGLARITASQPQTIVGKSRVTATGTQTILGQARVQITTSQTILGQSRVQITSPQTILGKSRIETSTPQIIQGKASISSGYITTAKTITGKASISSNILPPVKKIWYDVDGNIYYRVGSILLPV